MTRLATDAAFAFDVAVAVVVLVDNVLGLDATVLVGGDRVVVGITSDAPARTGEAPTFEEGEGDDQTQDADEEQDDADGVDVDAGGIRVDCERQDGARCYENQARSDSSSTHMTYLPLSETKVYHHT